MKLCYQVPYLVFICPLFVGLWEKLFNTDQSNTDRVRSYFPGKHPPSVTHGTLSQKGDPCLPLKTS